MQNAECIMQKLFCTIGSFANCNKNIQQFGNVLVDAVKMGIRQIIRSIQQFQPVLRFIGFL
jgi:hypothetical protein